MTNRDLLQGKSNMELVAWLDDTISEQPGETDWSLFPNFAPYEFKCPCGKCEMSTDEGVMDMDYKLMFILQTVRNKYGKKMTITSGGRCPEYNATLSNAVENSYHCKKKAADFVIAGVTPTESGRNEVVAFMKKLPGYKYSYHNVGGKYPKMGQAIHIEVK